MRMMRLICTSVVSHLLSHFFLPLPGGQALLLGGVFLIENSEFDQEISQSQTTDNPKAPRGSLIEHAVTKQTVKIVVRRRIMRRLIWVCTVCLGPIKRALD